METFFSVLNWVMLVMSGWGFFQALYNENWKSAIFSGALLTIFVYTMFFYHPAT